MKNDYEAILNCFADFPDVEQDKIEWTTDLMSGFIPIKIQKMNAIKILENPRSPNYIWIYDKGGEEMLIQKGKNNNTKMINKKVYSNIEYEYELKKLYMGGWK